MPLSSMLRAKLGLLDALEQMSVKFAAETTNSQNEHGLVQTNFFRARKSSVEALMASANGLQKRIHGVLNLVSFESLKVSRTTLTLEKLADTLNLKNQLELAKTNSHLLSLQRESVDDNETVKVITVVTLIYLPASFVAVRTVRNV
jgi:Mg2+ and Co2+ transporter CorA